MKTVIKVACIDQTLQLIDAPLIACGGREEDRVEFSFCPMWQGFVRLAVFWRDPKKAYHVPLDTADSCLIPVEVLQTEGVLKFGVFGVNPDGVRRTTEPLSYHIGPGSITEGTQPPDPTPELYTQLMVAAFTAQKDAQSVRADADAGLFQGKTAYQYAQESGYLGTEEEYAQDVNPGHLGSEVRQHGQRLDNIENALYPDIVAPVTDDSVAHIKDVPLNALPYAEVAQVGGMTRKCSNLIPFPYDDADGTTHHGITYSCDDNGMITASGAWDGTDISRFWLYYDDTNGIILPYDAIFSFSQTANSMKVNIVVNDKQLYGAPQQLYKGDRITGIRVYKDNEPGAQVNSTMMLMLNEGSTALPYEPYFEGLRSAPVTAVESVGANGIIDTLPIPEAVQALDGYGWGVSADCFNYIDWEKKQFVKRVEKTVFNGKENWYTASNGEITCNFGNTPTNPSAVQCVCSDYPAVSRNVAYNNRFVTGYQGIAMNNGRVIVIDNVNFNGDAEACKIFITERYAAGKPITLVYTLAEPVITDISHLLSDDNYIPVEGGGTITMVNEHSFAVPSTIEYTVKGASAQ